MLQADLILQYFPHLSSRQIEQFSMLDPLYREWNQRINVISRKDIDAIFEHHILHSLAIAKVIDFAPSAKILDIGTGGGFPGIPMAIFFPETKFHLIDSIAKKLKVVDAIVESLQLENVTSQHIRAEQLHAQYDFIVSRAVTNFHSFLPWIQGKMLNRRLHKTPNGAFFLKGGDVDDELGMYAKKATIFPISDFFPDPFYEGKKVIYLPAS
ncbi:MAG: 16S rRNA (guanine(527)-N(7))-methyltransferase RsmG [Bacteroidales bacterium]|jgi:16S rRNA (guanine527-N7)-methyltransferase|nr:16S rRNA (guanine(527)-N(7))-methyltransferase RsmG [Bacteroidales bacterium]